MEKINSKKLEEFATIYDNKKKLFEDRWGGHQKREKKLKERIEKELGGPTIFYSDVNELIREYETLTNRNRIKALEYLSLKDKASLTEIAEHLGTSIPTARKHLEILENAGMVSSKNITTGTGKSRIFVAETKLVKRGREEELLKKRILKVRDPKSFIYNAVKNTVLEIVKSEEFRKYVKKAGIEEEWEITGSLQDIIQDSSDAVIFEPHPPVQPIKEEDEFYEYESNFEILAACGRFDLIDKQVEEKCKIYADIAVFENLPKDEVLTNIKKHLEYIERLKEELRKKHGVGNDSR